MTYLLTLKYENLVNQISIILHEVHTANLRHTGHLIKGAHSASIATRMFTHCSQLPSADMVRF
jgi:hypothetical protein